MPQLKNTHQLERRARTIVESLKGTWRQGKGMCCCPAHDDRTPSLSVTLGRKAILFHCFAGCSNEDVIAALDRQGVRSRELFDGSGAGTANQQNQGDFSPNARRLWQSATLISDSPVERYLAQRGLQHASDRLRYLERTPLGPRGAVQFLPAMLAAVTTDIGIIAVHRTFLDVASGKLARFERPKRALGSLGVGAVRLAPAVQGRLGLAEGIESALSAMQLFGIPCWATLGNERFGLVSIPESVRELFLFIDNDAGGALAEERAVKAYAAPNRVLHSRAPASSGFDWNDELKSRLARKPRLRFASLEELNIWLEAECRRWAERNQHPDQEGMTIAQALEVERPMLQPLPVPFDGFFESEHVASSTCLVSFDRNRYSVMAKAAHQAVQVRAYATRIVIRCDGAVVAEHERVFGRNQTIFDPWHYLPILARKPGALRNGAPFQDWALPPALAQLRRKLGKGDDADRRFVRVLAAVPEDGLEAVEAAVREALSAGTISDEIILNILSRRREPHDAQAMDVVVNLKLKHPPEANCGRYDTVRDLDAAA